MRNAFPRSSERGPIEAAIPRNLSIHSCHFRAHPSAAPLKPISKPFTFSATKTFPRSSERGPIEASRKDGPREGKDFHFRAHPSAAPLKLQRIHFSQHSRFRFPRSSERGPIEARERMEYSPRQGNFRAHPSAAPVKLVSAWSIRRAKEISALIRARPH